VANYNEFALLTGLRPSERIALVWGDVDWNRRTVQVERSRVLAEVKPAKT
jgi:integrase